MTDDTETKQVTWIRWTLGVVILIAINFFSVAFYSGASNQRITTSEQRLDRLDNSIEKIQQNAVTKEQVEELKLDLKEIKTDIKEINRRQ